MAEIWRSQPPQRGLIQPISAGLLEQFVFSKQYFDPAGFIVATHEGQPIGFTHATFGPNDEGTGLSTDVGTTQMLMLDAEHRDPALADDLLAQSEVYLRGRGAKVVFAGGIRPLDAFYLGLYGGSELPGILDSDPIFPQAVTRNRYQPVSRVVVLQREIMSFRPPVSREQRQLRREVVVEECFAPASRNWWEACGSGLLERLHYRAVERRGRSAVASVAFWDVEPLASSWGLRTAGMVDLYVEPETRRKGYASLLLSEAFKELRKHGVTLVEAQTMQENGAALGLYATLGFATTDHGTVYRKEATAD